jgi:sugar phosphate isomerase/epimerase
MENCPYTSFGWGKNAVRLVQLIDSPAFRLLWDPAGGVRAGEPDCIQAIQAIMPLLAHMHGRDILPTSDGKGRYLAIGQGVVPWKIIFQELINQKYEGAISIEPHFLGSDGSKAGAVLESRNAMQEILSTLVHPEERSTL